MKKLQQNLNVFRYLIKKILLWKQKYQVGHKEMNKTTDNKRLQQNKTTNNKIT